jgi:thiosulfate dehydrogenase [quinone] large subunit
MLGIKKWELKHTVILLRIFIGWHFFYEGIIKVFNPDWTSFGYLATAQGPLQPLFLAMTNEPVLSWVDTMNWLVLLFVGVTLILGIREKWGAVAAIGLLALYYLAHPAFPWLEQLNVEGNYWFINKNLIELVACMVIYQFPTASFFGLERILRKNKKSA